jgi:DNA invertase Pin-like site-specific DNA recombinase
VAKTLLRVGLYARVSTQDQQTIHWRKLYRDGISKAEIARRLNIGRTSVRRILAANRR